MRLQTVAQALWRGNETCPATNYQNSGGRRYNVGKCFERYVVRGGDGPSTRFFRKDQERALDRFAADAKAAVAVALDELATGGYGGRDIERDELTAPVRPPPPRPFRRSSDRNG
jgi:hypothetical protein